MLSTDFLGMKLKNPIIVAAGPWNRDGKALHQIHSFRCGGCRNRKYRQRHCAGRAAENRMR